MRSVSTEACGCPRTTSPSHRGPRGPERGSLSGTCSQLTPNHALQNDTNSRPLTCFLSFFSLVLPPLLPHLSLRKDLLSVFYT